MLLVNRQTYYSNLFTYGIRSFAFLVFISVTLFHIPLYTATLPPYHLHHHHHHQHNSEEDSSIDRVNDRSGVTSSQHRHVSHNFSIQKRRTLDISVSMRICFEILAPSMEIGLQPPQLVMSMCASRIPPLLLVNGDNTNYRHHHQHQNQNHHRDGEGRNIHSNNKNTNAMDAKSSDEPQLGVVEDEEGKGQNDQHEETASSLSSSSSFITSKIRPQDRPYVQRVLRHFSSIVVLHDVAYVLYESTVRILKERHNITATIMASENEQVNDLLEQEKQFVASSSLSFSTLFSLIDFWTSEFPCALFWAFMENASQYLRVVDAVNWLRLLPSLTFLSPQVRGGIITFYLMAIFVGSRGGGGNNFDNDDADNESVVVVSCSFSDISWAFHLCAFVTLLEWIGAVKDRFVILPNNNNINNNNSNSQNENDHRPDDDDSNHPQRPTQARIRSVVTVIPASIFASQYNRKVLLQELVGYLLLQILVPPVVAGFVLSGLVALAMLVVV